MFIQSLYVVNYRVIIGLENKLISSSLVVKQALVSPAPTPPTSKPCCDPSRIFSQAMHMHLSDKEELICWIIQLKIVMQATPIEIPSFQYRGC